MMLVDSNVIIEFLHSQDPELQRLLKQHDAAVCGISRAEVLCGARNPKELKVIREMLGGLKQVTIPDAVWDNVGQNLVLLRSKGITVPFQDVALATVAIHHNLELWSLDNHFPLIKTVIPELKLFRPGQQPAG